MNKGLKWALISLPILAGGFIVYRALTKEKREAKKREKEQGGNIIPQTSGGSGQVGGGYTPPSPKADFPIGLGSRNEKVRELQQAIIDDGQSDVVTLLGKGGADGIFGTGTQSAVNKLLGKTKVDSQADIDTIKGLKAKREATANQQTATQQMKDLANKLAALANSQKKNATTINKTFAKIGIVTTDGRFVEKYGIDMKKGSSTGNYSYIEHTDGKKVTLSINTKSPKFRAYSTYEGYFVIHDSDNYFLLNPNDIEIR